MASDGPQVEPVLLGQLCLGHRCLGERGEPLPVGDFARNFEGRRAEQADILANRTVDRHRDLGRQKAVVAGPPLRRIEHRVADERPPAERHGHDAERAMAEFHVEHHEPVRDHRPGSDLHIARRLHDRRATEIGTRLPHVRLAHAQPAEIVDRERAVAEHRLEALRECKEREPLRGQMVRAVHRIAALRIEEPAQDVRRPQVHRQPGNEPDRAQRQRSGEHRPESPHAGR